MAAPNRLAVSRLSPESTELPSNQSRAVPEDFELPVHALRTDTRNVSTLPDGRSLGALRSDIGTESSLAVNGPVPAPPDTLLTWPEPISSSFTYTAARRSNLMPSAAVPRPSQICAGPRSVSEGCVLATKPRLAGEDDSFPV